MEQASDPSQFRETHLIMPGKTHRALRNSAIQGSSQILTWSLSWVLLVVLPRFLGDEGFGKLFLALSYSMVFSTLINLGINKYLIKEVAILNPVDEPDTDHEVRYAALRDLIGTAITLKLTLAVVVYLLMAGVAFLIPYDATTRSAILIIAVAACLNNLTHTVGGVFQGLESMVPITSAVVVEKIIATGGCTFLLFRGYGLLPVCFVYVIAAAANLAIGIVLLGRRIPFSLHWDWNLTRTLIYGGLPFLVWVVFAEIYARIDVLMLSLMTGNAVVGWYGAAFKIYATLLFVPHMLNLVVFPPLARMGAQAAPGKRQQFSRATARIMNLMLAVAIPIGVGTAIAARSIVELLYGEGLFENSIITLQLFSACIVLVCVDVVLGSVLIARGKQKEWSYMAIVAAFFNPLMNLWAIPLSQQYWGNGGIGAAGTTLLTEMLMMAGALRLMPSGMFLQGNLVTAAKAMVCAGFMTLILNATGLENVFAVAATGAIAYVATALAVRVLPPDDADHILHAAKLAGRFPQVQRLLFGIKYS
ncbi:MAG: flippase [Kiritimatiellales bacterium]|nr:flippase [Kiritimatiellales bacterium]